MSYQSVQKVTTFSHGLIGTNHLLEMSLLISLSIASLSKIVPAKMIICAQNAGGLVKAENLFQCIQNPKQTMAAKYER